MYADAVDEAAIFAAVDAFLDHLAAARPAAADCFATDADAALYGSENDEAAVGAAAIRRFLASLYANVGAPRFTLTSRRASMEGDVAWFTSFAEVELGGKVYAPYRLTGVLVRRDGRWLWSLFSGSEPLPPRSVG